MSSTKRKNVTSGIILILIGLGFLAFQLVPSLRMWAGQEFAWPVWIMLGGLGLLLIGALTGTAEMFIPACIVGGIGGILYFQNAGLITWESWAYLWTLIPGFVGIGIFLAGLVKWNRREIVDGLQTVLVSAVLFLIFGSLMGSMFGYFPFGFYLPVLLIALGVFMFIRAVLDRRR